MKTDYDLALLEGLVWNLNEGLAKIKDRKKFNQGIGNILEGIELHD